MRQLISIEDVGVATAFLAHDAARLITGDTLYVDGGYRHHRLSTNLIRNGQTDPSIRSMELQDGRPGRSPPERKVLAMKVAQAEADAAVRAMKAKEKAEAEKKDLLAQFRKPSGVSDEMRMKRAAKIIARAAADGKTEVEVYRFPNEFCTDKGRAINQGEAEWPETLTGLPGRSLSSGINIYGTRATSSMRRS